MCTVLCTAEAGRCSVQSHSHQLMGEGCWGQGQMRTTPLKGSGLLIAGSSRNCSDLTVPPSPYFGPPGRPPCLLREQHQEKPDSSCKTFNTFVFLSTHIDDSFRLGPSIKESCKANKCRDEPEGGFVTHCKKGVGLHFSIP